MTNIEKKLAELNGVTDALYKQEVSKLIRTKYNQNDVEAILNNYLEDPTDEKYIKEFKELQKFRAECKAQIKLELYGEEE